jgi:transcriptional regulator with XRE-family HTH domain
MSKDRPIARMRESKGLTQSELAHLIGVTENTIANWEKGGATKWISHLKSLCKVLNCNLDDLDPSQENQKNIISRDFLTSTTINTIRSYCESLLNNDKKSVAKISSFATLHDESLRHWLDQADKVTSQFKQKSLSKINYEMVVSTLILQDLNIRLSQTLPNQVTFEKFRDSLKKLELSRDFLSKYSSFDNKKISRKLILQTRYLCVYAIGWEPNQISLMHHHGNSLDAIWVIEGEMTHWSLSPKQCEEEKVPFEGCTLDYKYSGNVKPTTSSESSWIFVDRRNAHQIENSSKKRLFTLHIRFGAPPDDDKWVETEEEPVIIWHQTEQYQVMPG